ncbi:MAG: hypothetical protein MSA07_08740 [Mucispirillum sp.]|nr:hypothetical protein [Mucispirillum sp.]
MKLKGIKKEVIQGFLDFPYQDIGNERIDMSKVRDAFEFVKKNIETFNDEVVSYFTEYYNELINKYKYFATDCFSPLRSNANVFAAVNEDVYKETAYTSLLGYFLRDRDFGQDLFRSLLISIGIYDKYTLENVQCEQKDYIRRYDVVCICNDESKLIIEAKINAIESESQTDDIYLFNADDTFAFIYLTVDSSNACNEHFKSLSWNRLAAAFYAGYNTYRYKLEQNLNNDVYWKELDFSKTANTNNGIYLQMWLSNIMTYLYDIEEISNGDINQNEHLSIYTKCAEFIKDYENIMEELNGY